MRTLLPPAAAFAAGLALALLVASRDDPSATTEALGPREVGPRPATLSTAGERLDRDSVPAAPPSASAPARPPASLPASVPAPSAVAFDAPARRLDPGLQAALEAEVARAVAAAERAARGRADGSNCQVAFQVLDLDRDLIVAERLSGAWMEPASNLKLVTTLAALVALGPEWRFRTPVEAHGPLAGGVLEGDLLVRAGGDPLYADGDPGHGGRRLDALARELADAGLRRVRGDLLLDLGDYPEPGPAPGWPPSNASWTGSYAYVSGLTANGGVVQLDFEAGPGGTRTAIAPLPNGLEHSGRVGAANRRVNDVAIGMYDSTLQLTVGGVLGPVGEEFTSHVRHPRPALMFAALFEQALERAGILVEGSTRQGRGTPPGRTLAVLESPWIDLITPINRDSVNGVADAVFLAVGLERRGAPTRAAARAAVAEVLDALGLAADGFAQVGGSGLSRDNRVSPEMLVAVLRQVDRGPRATRERLLGSLAVAGESGTLERRMRGTAAAGRVRAKTGFIRGASALSGYAEGLDGTRYAFSILVGYPRLAGLNNSAWKPMHDAIVERIVERRR